jgi:hypothetical protein
MDRRSKWKDANPDKVLDYQMRWHQDLRKRALAALGGMCVKCGFSDERALQIDHVHGLSGQEREHRSKMYKRVLSGTHSGAYQLLCANCNWIKRAERGEHGTHTRRPRKENAA